MIPLPWLLTSIVFLGASDKACVQDDPSDCRQTVVAGEEVPFDGQLLSPRRAARLAVQAGQCQERIVTEVARAVELIKIDLELEKGLRANDADAAAMQTDLLKGALQDARESSEPGFLEHPLLWFTIGVAATAAAIGLTVAILDATRPQVVTISENFSQGSSLFSW